MVTSCMDGGGGIPSGVLMRSVGVHILDNLCGNPDAELVQNLCEDPTLFGQIVISTHIHTHQALKD